MRKVAPIVPQMDEFLKKRIKPNYSLQIQYFEIHNPKYAQLMLDLAKAYGAKKILKEGTPAVFVGDKAFQGSSRGVQRKIEVAVRRAVQEKPPSPLSLLHQQKKEEEIKTHLTLTAVAGAAAADSINPCACAVLVLLLGSILIASNRKKCSVIGAGFSFTAACFISYFLMGLGLFTAIQVAGIQHYVYLVVSILAVLLGLWNIKDFFWKNRWFKLQVPSTWQPGLKKIISRINSVPGAFFIGFIISLFLLPCTSGPYIVIIGMLSKMSTLLEAILLLLVYNLIFVLPFIFLTLTVGLGFTTTARAEKWRQEKQAWFNLFTGIFMLGLGITLVVLLSLEII